MREARETILYPGTFTEVLKPKNGAKTLEALVRAEMRKNGYPTNSCLEVPCDQPNICDLLTDCELGSGSPPTLCSFNGLNGSGLEGNCYGLGGTLAEVTTIDTDTFDFSVTKDNVLLDINDAGGSLGAGETARFLGTNGTITAEVGVYTSGGGAPSTGSRTYNSATDFYTWIKHDTALEQLSLRSGLAANVDYFHVGLDETSVVIGHSTAAFITVKEEPLFTGGTHTINVDGLVLYADSTAAASDGLPAGALYLADVGGGNRAICIVQ